MYACNKTVLVAFHMKKAFEGGSFEHRNSGGRVLPLSVSLLCIAYPIHPQLFISTMYF